MTPIKKHKGKEVVGLNESYIYALSIFKGK